MVTSHLIGMLLCCCQPTVTGKNDMSIRNTTAWELCDLQPHRKAVSEVLHAIINRSCYHGFGCMQYKLSPDGIPKVIEVNPRVCGSLNSRVDRFHKMIRAYLKEVSATLSLIHERGLLHVCHAQNIQCVKCDDKPALSTVQQGRAGHPAP